MPSITRPRTRQQGQHTASPAIEPEGQHPQDGQLEHELSAPTSAAGHRRRRALGLVAAIAVVLGVSLLLGKAAGYQHVLHALRTAQPIWLVIALPAEIAAYVGYTMVLQRAAELSGGPSISTLIGARLALTSVAATRLIIAGGPGFLYWALRRAHSSTRGALVRLAALNVLLYAVFAGMAGLAALAVLLGEHGQGAETMAFAWLLGIAIAFLVLLVAGGLASLSVRARQMLKLAYGLAWSSKRASTFAGAGLFWFGDILCLWAGLRAFDVEVGMAALIVAYASSYMVTMLPFFLGGVGGPEAALALALHVFGAPLAPALLGVLAYRAISFWLPTIPGLALLSTVGQLGDQLEHLPASDR